jgi:hypothetical protein
MKSKSAAKIGLLAALALVAAAVLYYEFSPTESSAGANTLAAIYVPMGVETSQIHWDRLSSAQDTEYKPTGRNIFFLHLPLPPAPPPVHIPQPGDADYEPPVIPPPPPKLPLKFFGYGIVSQSTKRRAFLTDGDVVYIVGEGDNVLGHYRILKISSVSLEFEDIGSGRHAYTTLEDQAASK